MHLVFRRDLLAVTGLGLVLRGFRLGAQNLWIDEAFTARLLSGSFPELIRATANDNHPPLYYAILFALAPFGRSEVWLRLPSLVCGVAAIPVIYALALLAFDRSTAFTSALLMAVSPLHVYYSQEARMYALLILLALAASWFYVRACERDSAGDWIGYTLTSVLAFYVHVAGILVPAALAVHFLAQGRGRHSLRRWLAAHAAIAVLSLPWVVVALAMFARVGAKAIAHVSLSPFALPYTLFTFAVGYFAGPSVDDLHRSFTLADLVPHLPIVAAAAVPFGGAFLAGLWRMRRDRFRLGLITAIMGVTIVAPYAVALLLSAKYNARYALVAMPFFVMTVAFGATGLGVRARFTCVGALLVLSCHALGHWYFDPYYGKPRIADAVRYVQERIQPGDAVLGLGVTLSLRHYWPDREVLPISWGRPSDAGREEYATMLVSQPRTWVILGREWDGDPHGTVRDVLAERLRPLETAQFSGVTVSLYQPRANGAPG